MYKENAFKRAQSELWLRSPEFYVLSWRLVRQILKEIDSSGTSKNVELINNNISDNQLCDRLHEIRVRRNKYEHREPGYKLPKKSVIEEDAEILNNFFDYVNEKIGNNEAYTFCFTSNTHEKNENNANPELKSVTRSQSEGIEFEYIEGEISSRENMCIGCYEDSYNSYKGGYNSSSIRFRILQERTKWVSNPVFAVVHNLLLRDTRIKESKYISKNSNRTVVMDYVFIYEFLILNAARHGLLDHDLITFRVNKSFMSSFKLAIGNIIYWESLIKAMMGTKSKRKYTVKSAVLNDENIIELDINGIKISAEILNNRIVGQYNPLWIDQKIDYRLSRHNYKYFQQLLQETFGHDNFREGQYLTIKEFLSKNSNALMVILPTGYGKSLLYQFLAIIQPLPSFVIAPTEELIFDQLMNMNEAKCNIGGKYFIHNSLQNPNLKNRPINLEKIYFSKLVYYSTPKEILKKANHKFISRLNNSRKINQVTIDECHHMSMWGHRFEVEFFTVTMQLLDITSSSKILLCSATASNKVKADLQRQIGPDEMGIIQPVSLDRGHINYEFIVKSDLKNVVKDIVKKLENKYITNVKRSSTQDQKDLAESLTIIVNNSPEILKRIYFELIDVPHMKHNVVIYSGEKNSYLRFRSGLKKILLCTEDFLYGINFMNLRHIIFIGYTPSKEWFYQQTGRVGRQGEESHVTNYIIKEKSELLNFILDSYNSEDEILNRLSATFEKSVDLSNTKVVSNAARNKEEELLTISNIFEEMKKKVYVSSTYANEKYQGGVLRATINKKDKEHYEFSLYVMFAIGLIRHWIIEDDTGEIVKYLFHVDMAFESNSIQLEQRALNLIKELSLTDELQDKFCEFIFKLEGTHNALLTILEWTIINSVAVERQMLINQVEFSDDIATGQISDEVIELDLNNYFLGNTFLNMNVDSDSQVFQSLDQFTKITEDEMNYEVLVENNSDAQEMMFISNMNNNTTNKISSKENKAIVDQEAIEPKYSPAVGEQVITDYFFRKYSDRFSGNNEFTSGEIYEIGSYLYNTANLSEKYKIKGFVERAIEDRHNLNSIFILSMFELIDSKRLRFSRLKVTVAKLGEKDSIKFISIFSDTFTSKSKIAIDEILNENNYQKIFYRGFVGWLKKLFKL